MDKKVFIYKQKIEEKKNITEDILKRVSIYSIDEKNQDEFVKKLLLPFIIVENFLTKVNNEEFKTLNNHIDFVLDEIKKIDIKIKEYIVILRQLLNEIEEEEKNKYEDKDGKTELSSLISIYENIQIYNYIDEFNDLNEIYTEAKKYMLLTMEEKIKNKISSLEN